MALKPVSHNGDLLGVDEQDKVFKYDPFARTWAPWMPQAQPGEEQRVGLVDGELVVGPEAVRPDEKKPLAEPELEEKP